MKTDKTRIKNDAVKITDSVCCPTSKDEMTFKKANIFINRGFKTTHNIHMQ